MIMAHRDHDLCHGSGPDIGHQLIRARALISVARIHPDSTHLDPTTHQVCTWITGRILIVLQELDNALSM